MARKRKLNKRVILLLSILGGVSVAAVAVIAVVNWLPKDATPFILSADAAAEKGDLDSLLRAERGYGEAIRRIDKDTVLKADTYYKLAQVRWAIVGRDEYVAQRNQKVQGALQAAQTAISLNRDRVDAHKLLAMILLEMGAGAPFVKEAETVLQSEPDNHELRFQMISVRAALTNPAEVGQVKDIVQQFKDLIEMSPQPEHFIALAGFLERVQGFGDPGDVLKDGIARNPQSGHLAIAYGGYLLQKGQTESTNEGVAWLAKAKELAGDDANVWETLAMYDFRRGKLDDAIASTNRIKELDATNPRSYLMEGMIYAAGRQMQKAIDTYRAGLEAIQKSSVGSPSAKNIRDIRSLREARARQSGKFTIYLRLGESLLDRVLFDTGRDLTKDERQAMLDEAQRCLDQVIAAAGEDSYEANSILGRLSLVNGNRTAAVRQLQLAYDKAPNQMTTALWLYEANILNQEPGKAEKILQNFLDIGKRTRNQQMYIQANVWLARHYLERFHDPKVAEQYVGDVLKVIPDHPEAIRIQRHIALLQGTGVDPEMDLETLSMNVLYVRVQKMVAQGEGDKAVEMVEPLYYRDPSNLMMFELLANLYLQTRQVDKAKDLIAELKAQKPDDKKLQEQLDIQLAILNETDPAKQYLLALERADARSDDLVLANLDKARIAASVGKREDCERFLSLAEEAGPDDTRVISSRFDFAVATGDFVKAQVYADKAAAGNIDRCDGMKYHAILLRAQNKLNESAAAMEKVLELLPEEKSIRGALGELYLSMGRPDKAREHFRYLADADPTNFPSNYYMAKLTEDDPAQRNTHFEYVRRCQLARPENPDVRHWILNLMEQGGQINQAIEKREQLAQQYPGDTRNLLALANLYKANDRLSNADDLYQGLLMRAANPLPVAERYCRFLIDTDQSSQVHPVMEAMLRDNRVDKVAGFLAFGDLLTDINVADAREAYQKAINEAARLNQEEPRPLLAMARFLGRQGALSNDPAAAMEFNKESIAFYEKWFASQASQPASAGVMDEEYRLIGLRIKVGQIDQAKARLEEILRADNGNMKAQFTLAELYRAQKDDVRALEILDSAVNLNSRSSQPLMVRAAYYQELGDLPRAQADIERAREMDPNNMTVGQSLAVILMRQHKHGQAVVVLTEMLMRDRSYGPAADLLLSAYLLQKDWGNVQSQLRGARTRAGSDRLRQIELYMIESQMHREAGRTRDSLLAMDNALLLAKDDVRVLARWLDAYVNAGEYDKVLRKVKENPGEAYRPLRLYEAAALLGKGNVSDANELLTDMVKNAKGELIIILDYIARHYKSADGLAVAQQWISLRDEASISMFIGDMHDLAREIAAAEQAYRKGLSQATTTGEKLHLHSRLAQMLYRESTTDQSSRQGLLKKVVESWQAVLELDPGNFAAMNNLAYIFTDELDDPASALPYAIGAYNRDPQPDVMDTLGWTKARLAAAVGDRDQRSRDLVAALGVLRQAYDLETQLKISHTVTICYHLGWAYEQLGDMKNALEFYRYAEAALKDDDKDPLYAVVRDAKARVEKK